MIVSTPRRIVIIALAILTAWYVGVMIGNTTPHGTDQTRWEHTTIVP